MRKDQYVSDSTDLLDAPSTGSAGDSPAGDAASKPTRKPARKATGLAVEVF